ncbi:MAG: hypothetical protein LUC24_03440, partial [Bacteroidales bacterium]|nr:hypothetical protein [Bacteroidales bacterium]
MAKYIVKYGSETATNEGRPAEYATREEAATALIYAVSNALLCTHIDPAKFRIEEVPDEPKDVPDLIPDYKAACAYLDGVGWPSTKDIDVRESVFAKLLTLCKAWNRADNWEEPNWKNSDDKWFPEIL